MYAKIYNLKFVSPTDAKVASSYFAEHLAKFIRPCNMQSINISLGPCGSLSITAKFDGSLDLKNFESKTKYSLSEEMFSELETSYFDYYFQPEDTILGAAESGTAKNISDYKNL